MSSTTVNLIAVTTLLLTKVKVKVQREGSSRMRKCRNRFFRRNSAAWSDLPQLQTMQTVPIPAASI